MNTTEETTQIDLGTSKNTPLSNINRTNISNVLYSFFQEKYADYIHQRRNDLKFYTSNKINSKITCDEYLNSPEQVKKLTPMPYISKRKIINFNQEKKFNEFKGSIIMMRRYEYTQKIDQSKLLLKYSIKNIRNIVLIQKVIRGFIVRKIMNEVKLLKETLTHFSLSITFCIKRKCYSIIKNYLESTIKEQKKEIIIDIEKEKEQKVPNIINSNEEKNKEIINNEINTSSIINENDNKKHQQIIIKKNFDNLVVEKNIVNVEIKNIIPANFTKNDNNVIETETNNNVINAENDDDIIQNDYYIDFNFDVVNNKKDDGNSMFKSKENNVINNKNKESLQSGSKICDMKKISLLILLKHYILFNIKTYVFSMFKNNIFSDDDELNKTKEDNYFEVKEERINVVNEVFNIAINHIK